MPCTALKRSAVKIAAGVEDRGAFGNSTLSAVKVMETGGRTRLLYDRRGYLL